MPSLISSMERLLVLVALSTILSQLRLLLLICRGLSSLDVICMYFHVSIPPHELMGEGLTMFQFVSRPSMESAAKRKGGILRGNDMDGKQNREVVYRWKPDNRDLNVTNLCTSASVANVLEPCITFLILFMKLP